MKSFLLFAAFIGVALITSPPRLALADDTPATNADDAERLVLAEATPLSLLEMEEMRGGFVDPSGMIFSFGVNVQTALDGAQVFSRSILVTATGPNGALQATSNATLLPKNIPTSLAITMIGNGKGLIVTTPDNENSTTALNQTASGAPASIIFNTANNRAISQTVDVTLTLQNMSAFINNLRAASQGAAMAQHAALKSMGF